MHGQTARPLGMSENVIHPKISFFPIFFTSTTILKVEVCFRKAFFKPVYGTCGSGVVVPFMSLKYNTRPQKKSTFSENCTHNLNRWRPHPQTQNMPEIGHPGPSNVQLGLCWRPLMFEKSWCQKKPFFTKLRQFQYNPRCELESPRCPLSSKVWGVHFYAFQSKRPFVPYFLGVILHGGLFGPW